MGNAMEVSGNGVLKVLMDGSEILIYLNRHLLLPGINIFCFEKCSSSPGDHGEDHREVVNKKLI